MESIRKICFILIIGILLEAIVLAHSSPLDFHAKRKRSVKEENEGYGSANYQFQYAVINDGNDFSHGEQRNGETTKGKYSVLLPDGRLQVVTYVADENGYRADVTYEVSGSGYSTPTTPNSYIPPKPPTKTPSLTQGQSYNGQRRNSGSFVNLKRNIGGRNHDYNFTF